MEKSTNYEVVNCGPNKFIKLSNKLVVNINRVFAIRIEKDPVYIRSQETYYEITFILDNNTTASISGFKIKEDAEKTLDKILDLISD